MREHLIQCFNQKYMDPFPKKKLKEPMNIEVISIDTDLLCCCSIPDVKGLGPWVASDVCDQWYLLKCEGINANKITKTKLYVCKMCKV